MLLNGMDSGEIFAELARRGRATASTHRPGSGSGVGRVSSAQYQIYYSNLKTGYRKL
jgi:hypothetical protein